MEDMIDCSLGIVKIIACSSSISKRTARGRKKSDNMKNVIP
jgi:hypothetical protein